MPLDVRIQDSDLEGFSPEAKSHLHSAVEKYSTDLIEEANRIEAGRNSSDGPPEVTRGMVQDAQDSLHRGLVIPKKSQRGRVLRVFAAILPLLVGITYDPAKLQQGGYMLFFILLVAAAILVVTISTLKE